MRKFVLPIMAAAFLAIAGTAAMPNTANAGSVSVGVSGNGFGIYYNDSDRRRGGHHRHYRARRSCEPIYRTQRHWTRHGWKRMRVHVGYHCDRIPRGYRGHRGHRY